MENSKSMEKERNSSKKNLNYNKLIIKAALA